MATGLPTLSQIRAWDIDHLIEAAEHWGSTADRWDNVYGQVWQQSLGMDWRGQAREALIDRTTTDTTMVTQKSDQLREAALAARKGAGDISAAQRSVLNKIDDAHEAGFVVGEDLSVTDTQTSRNAAALAARQVQAQALSADLRSRAAQLLAADGQVGTKLTAAAGDVGSLTFNEKAVIYSGKPMNAAADPRNGKIQLVDWKQAPNPTPSPAHTGQDVRQAIKNLPKGTGPFVDEIRSEQDLRNLWNWATEGSTPSDGSKYPGTERLLPDGTRLGMRESDDHGQTMEIRTPDKSYTKIHVNSDRGGVPEIPARTAGPPEGAAPEQHAPVESAPVEGAPAEAPEPHPAPEPSAPMGPAGSNPLPHFVEPPHSHHGPPIVGRDDLSDPEFGSP
jgi:hypothetical protein